LAPLKRRRAGAVITNTRADRRMIALDPKTKVLVLIDLQKGVLQRKLEPISAEQLLNGARRFPPGFAPLAPWLRRSRAWLGQAGRPQNHQEELGAFSVPELDWKLRRRGVAGIALGGRRY
jgi:hypothetical protein